MEIAWSDVHIDVVEKRDQELVVAVRSPLGSARVTMDCSRQERLGLTIQTPAGEYTTAIDSWTDPDDVGVGGEEGMASIIRLMARAAIQCLYKERRHAS